MNNNNKPKDRNTFNLSHLLNKFDNGSLIVYPLCLPRCIHLALGLMVKGYEENITWYYRVMHVYLSYVKYLHVHAVAVHQHVGGSYAGQM